MHVVSLTSGERQRHVCFSLKPPCFLSLMPFRIHFHATMGEPLSSVGVVGIPWPVMHIQDLIGLGHGAKQGVVAAGALLFLLEAGRGSLLSPGVSTAA